VISLQQGQDMLSGTETQSEYVSAALLELVCPGGATLQGCSEKNGRCFDACGNTVLSRGYRDALYWFVQLSTSAALVASCLSGADDW
jgi:hypothetical protein